MWFQHNALLFLGVVLLINAEEITSNLFRTVFRRGPRSLPKTRIVGGDVAVPHSEKYMVYMELYDRAENRYDYCGGTLISQNYVLTARHCLLNKDSGTLLLGFHNTSTNNLQDRAVRFTKSANYIVNKDFDIGLIHLNQPVSRTKYIDLVALPTSADVNKTYLGQTATAFGWGDTGKQFSDVLRFVNVAIVPCGRCDFNETCTSGAGGKGACFGDSGGPLTLHGVQIGVISWGNETCSAGEPTHYVSVHKNLEWIRNHSDAVIL